MSWVRYYPDAAATVAIQVNSSDDDAFSRGLRDALDDAVRVSLDGEAIYSQPAPLAQSHRVEVERPYGTGTHVVEFEVLAASVSPSTYTATWTVQVTPGGPFFTADGVPTVLTVGERLTVRVPL